jgi:hypothetical protein
MYIFSFGCIQILAFKQGYADVHLQISPVLFAVNTMFSLLTEKTATGLARDWRRQIKTATGSERTRGCLNLSKNHATGQ